ncbi:ATP-binding protein [Halobaculum marinum]|uniref:ATP-binding protein n=1 Tax=Halobaculum marinum TaxID=3031996 RepID=A0ABD5WS69_9EURY|nr:ATP-binding protein [Halobaculum sp. DT55]
MDDGGDGADDWLDERTIASVRGDVRAFWDSLEAQAAQNVAQIAYSVDGRTFAYEAPLTASLPVGGYVTLNTPDERTYLGQVVTKSVVHREGAQLGLDLDVADLPGVPEGVNLSGVSDRLQAPALEGTGTLLGRVETDGFQRPGAGDTFHRATIERADAALVDRYLAGSERHARLPIGRALYVDGEATVRLDAPGFSRHTFLCGQSGSGKTFSLGIVLEQLLLETDLRIVVVDPNSDFTSLGQLRSLEEVNRVRRDPLSPDAYDRLAERYREATAGLRVFRPAAVAGDDDEVLRLRFGDLSRTEQATAVGLHPLADRAEFNTFWHILDQLGGRDYSWDEVRQAIARDYSEAARQLGLRIENLGIADWETWCSRGESSLLDTLAGDDWRCLVLDVGTLGTPSERAVVSNAVLTDLWSRRAEREPTLVVVDEAHNVCPRDPADELVAISTEAVNRIAAEGRKYGQYLLLSTQRPTKLAENTLSQCENLILMRMHSRSDLATLAGIFSHVPTGLLEEATGFGLGEAVLGGRFVQNPTFARFDGRLSVEGGSDVPATWARPHE